jgi:DNA-directed RNA polymerase subunit RPC12/RpoP
MAEYKSRSRQIARDRFWSDKNKSEYDCPDCSRSYDEIDDTFEVHHKDGEPHNNSMSNLVALCPLCHKLRENKKPSISEIKQLREQNKQTSSSNHEASVKKLIDLRAVSERACLELTEPPLCNIEPTDEEETQLYQAGVAEGESRFSSKLNTVIESILNSESVACQKCGISGNIAQRVDGHYLNCSRWPKEGEPDEFATLLCFECAGGSS